MYSKNVTFCVSQDLSIPLKVKIISLEGSKPLLRPSQTIINPQLSQIVSNVQPNSDMFVSVKILDKESDRSLTIPIYTSYVPFKNSRTWDQWLTLPININQLNTNSILHITLWEYDSDSPSVFYEVETFIFNKENNIMKRGKESIRFTYDEPGNFCVEQNKIQRLINMYHQKDIKPIEWLDNITLPKLEKQIMEHEFPKGIFLLNIEFPLFRFPIVYTEHLYSNIQTNIPTFHNYELILNFTEKRQELQNRISLGSENDSTLKFYDPDQYNNDLIEEKFRRLERASKNSNLDRELKPDTKKRDMLNSIIGYPPGTKLSEHEKGLIWTYRYYLSSNKKALTKLLQSTNLNEENERKEVLNLMDIWAEINIDDAIELLGPNYRNISVRSYAVNRLKKASDTDLELYLLQLVQAVCFEGSSGLSEKSNSEFMIVDIEQNKNIYTDFSPSQVLNSLPSINDSIIPSLINQSFSTVSPLAEFLIRRAITNARLGNFFYWYLKAESNGNLYLQHILESFMNKLSDDRRSHIKDQSTFILMLRNLSEEVKQLKDTTPKKQELLEHLISTKLRPLLRYVPIELPLDPSVVIIDILPENCKVYKSSLSPLKLTFKTIDKQSYSLMYKVGDDLRQDQLVVQIITLMNELLKNENVDLKLMPYKILSTGENEGAIQFIPNDTMANILTKYHGILPFLRDTYPDNNNDLGVQSWVMDNFVKSCAGYCVITYILGVGDRHLDNLLITPDGRFFHADFGYILGHDPKPFPPLMKLPPQIIDAFGGAESANYNKFRSYCFVAYSILRRNAGLILNLFELMKTADIPDIKIDPDGAILKVKEKFGLDMSEEEATVHFQNLINASVNALLPLVIDHLHNLAQYWRA